MRSRAPSICWRSHWRRISQASWPCPTGGRGTATPIFPQFIDPDPGIISNVQFRRALLMGIDRQELNDTLNFGLGTVANTWLQTDRPEYPSVASQVVAYDHDPRRAIGIIEGL